MSKNTGRKIFVNLAVRDLPRTKAFFSALGFDYNPKFTDDNAACMVVSDEGYVMVLAEPFSRHSPNARYATPLGKPRHSLRCPATVGMRWMSW